MMLIRLQCTNASNKHIHLKFIQLYVNYISIIKNLNKQRSQQR